MVMGLVAALVVWLHPLTVHAESAAPPDAKADADSATRSDGGASLKSGLELEGDALPGGGAGVSAGVEVDPKTGNSDSDGQQNIVFRYLESIFGMPDDPAKARFIAYPVVAYAPETSWEFGVSSLYVYHSRDNPENRISEVGTFGFVTLAGQYGLHVDHANYTDKDKWFFLGKGRVQSFPLQYYGIGSDTPKDPLASVDQSSIVFKERALRQIIPSLYFGPEFGFDRLSKVRFNFEDGVAQELPRGGNGSLNLGVGLGLLYDNCHNVLNVRDGFFSELAVLHYNQAWGSDFSFWTFESDTRLFIPINARDTLAFQLYGRMTTGDVPYNEMSTLGGESLMRGYYLGRFRDKHFVGTQLEYRFLPLPFRHPFMKRFGASVFGATGAVFSEPGLPDGDNFVFAGGAGLRFLLFPDKDIYTRGDFAFTNEGGSFYLFIGEAF